MTTSPILRFGPGGTLLLAVVPLLFTARYLLSHRLVRYTMATRLLDDSEHERLDTLLADTDLTSAEVVVATDVETQLAVLSGTPWNRLLLLSEATLETTTDEELTGVIGIAAGKHAVWMPELYAGYLIVASAAFVTFLGVDPSGLSSPLVAGLVVVVLLAILGLGPQLLRDRVYAADQVAIRRVGRDSVKVALDVVPSRQLPEWVPSVMDPKPSKDQRRDQLS